MTRTKRYAVIGCKLKQNANEGCNSCASLAWLALRFIECFIVLVIAPWRRSRSGVSGEGLSHPKSTIGKSESGRSRKLFSYFMRFYACFRALWKLAVINKYNKPTRKLCSRRKTRAMPPATRHKWTRPALTPASKLVLDLPSPEGRKAE